MLLKTSSSQEKVCEREWAIGTKEFIGDQYGNLRALKIVDLEWKITEDGRASGFAEIPGTERELPCELALLAMGLSLSPVPGIDFRFTGKHNRTRKCQHREWELSI
jgi:NADPH-dependent glutamate synthase beta subunit-like oxidoreductase